MPSLPLGPVPTQSRLLLGSPTRLVEASVTYELNGEWIRQTVERLTGLENIWVKPDFDDDDPGWTVIQGLKLQSFWLSAGTGERQSDVEIWDCLVDNGWPVVGSRPTRSFKEPVVLGKGPLKLDPKEIQAAVDEIRKPERPNDHERDALIWEMGFRRALLMVRETCPTLNWPDYHIVEEMENNPFAAPQEAQGKLLEALQDRDALLGALGPYALQMACSTNPDAVDYEDCGKCHNCRSRALYSPIIKWIKKGYRRAAPPST